jgi:hypothetical protein
MTTTSDPVQMLIDAGAIPASPYSESSRYRGVALTTWSQPDGSLVAHGKRRFIASRREIAIAAGHLVRGGERPDLIAHLHYQQPLLQWRIADGNAVLDPFELTDTLGARIAVPVPPGAG